MKRLIASALIVGVSSLGLVGCEQKEESKVTSQTKTPTGTETKTTTVKDEKTGDKKD